MVLQRRLVAAAITALWWAVACADSPTSPDPDPEPQIASIVVSSPIDTVLAVGGATNLAAAATASDGRPIQGSFEWRSSDEGVVTVSTSGRLTGVAVGSAVITALSGGKSGQLRIRVVDADLASIKALIDDPLRGHLTNGLSADVRAAVQSALGQANTAATSGHVIALRDACLAVGSAADAANDPTDRALLAV